MIDGGTSVDPREFIPGPSLRDQPGWSAAKAKPNGIEEVVVTADGPEDSDFGFWDFVDLINPLQHIPVVSTVYREITGDEIKQGSKVFGAALLGGPIGAGAALIDVMVEESTGRNMGEHTMAFLFGEGEDDRPPLDPQPTGPLLADAGPRFESPKQPADGSDGRASETQVAIASAQASRGRTRQSDTTVINAEDRFLPVNRGEPTADVIARARRAISESLMSMRGELAESAQPTAVPGWVDKALTKYAARATTEESEPVLDRRL